MLRIGTRKSQLALWQANYVRQQLLQRHPGLSIELVKMTTQGDKILDTPLAKIGGKGLFIKELEQALLDRRVDLAVHSTKDIPAQLPDGLHISAICEREDPRDAFVCNDFSALEELADGAHIGTSSLRRQCQLHAHYPSLRISPLRGNVNTRLAKLDAGDYDAIILAAAGLKRLGFESRIRAYLAPEQCLPAAGQGAVSIECRQDDSEVNTLLQDLNHLDTQYCIEAERGMNAHLEGGCQVPIGAYAQLHQGVLHLRGLVGSPDGSQIVTAAGEASPNEASALGIQVAQSLLDQGAREILDVLDEHG